MMTEPVDRCVNCGTAIGKLETPMVWEEEVVCVECHAKLSKAETYRHASAKKYLNSAPSESEKIQLPVASPKSSENDAGKVRTKNLYRQRDFTPRGTRFKLPKVLWASAIVVVFAGLGLLIVSPANSPGASDGTIFIGLAGLILGLYL